MAPSLFSLHKSVALVTGANTGIGQAIAVALAEAGADVIAVGRTEPRETEAAVLGMGRRFRAIHADLAHTDCIPDTVATALAQFGRIDILVNNAGIIRRSDAVDFTEADWDAVVDVNLKSVFFLTQAIGRHMIQTGHGKVINVASLLSFQGGIRVASYTASKSGLAGLTRLLANEWASKGVNVNAIAPGYFATNNTSALRADENRSREILSRIPAGRWGHPSDLAGAAVFLAAPASDYVHGAIIPVDGGWLAR
jgi:2-dehydro-3-deoxy-D-gluconate 5-dehydrogenase